MSSSVFSALPPDPGEVARVDGALVERSVPQSIVRRDHVLPILTFASLLVHATIILPSLLRRDESVRMPSNEIPIEVVQLPPSQEKPKPEKPKPEKPKPETPKPETPKPAATKPAPPKPRQAAQKQPPKPASESESGTERLRNLIGAMPAIALPAASAEGTDAVSYAQLVLSQVAKAKKQGRYEGVEGAASVSFTLGDSGEVARVAIVRPSGDRSLDEEAIAMIKRGAPYPPPPPGGRREYTITLRFQSLI